MNLEKFSPIGLFVYKRLSHTQKVIEALKRCDLHQNSDLYIFSDGPKKDDSEHEIAEVRNYIQDISGFRSVQIIEREKNIGLANSIIEGTSFLCKKYGRAIILEDDIVLAPNFLKYINEALNLYSEDEVVMQISGNMFPLKNPGLLPDSFFCKMSTSWGWATWDRAWKRFNPNAQDLLKKIETKVNRHEFNIGGYDYLSMLKMQAENKISSWAIRWYASMFIYDGLCLHPSYSMVENIGFDDSGTHCKVGHIYKVKLDKHPLITLPHIVEELPAGRKALEEFFMDSKKLSIRNSILRIKHWFSRARAVM